MRKGLILALLLLVSACAQTPDVRVQQIRPDQPVLGRARLPGSLRRIPIWFVYDYKPEIEDSLLSLLNIEKSRYGTGDLLFDEGLRDLAREYSRAMARRKGLSISDADARRWRAGMNEKYPGRDWRIFRRKVPEMTENQVAGAIMSRDIDAPSGYLGERWGYPQGTYTTRNATTIGIGVYQASDGFYATAILLDHWGSGG